ncbi:Alpha/Beta hydrolase protein [Pelomyxa schiedti]|nr:Alpha/Beta hydrolase protein [Pelomyxa schiedti]
MSSTLLGHTLYLSDGRRVDYATGGDPSSTRVVFSIHGVFGVGRVAPHVSSFFSSLGWRVVAPTLPGWGASSPWPRGLALAHYALDMQQILSDALGGGRDPARVVVFGGSWGSVWALACAACAPPGYVSGLYVLGGFSPFREHYDYTEGMTWLNWLSVGRPSRWWPLSWLQPAVGWLLQKKIAGNVPGSLELLRSILTGPSAMTTEERTILSDWALSKGTTFDDWELGMARDMAHSVEHTLDGYLDVPDLLNGDWGFSLSQIQIAADSGDGTGAETSTTAHPTVLRIAGPGEIPPKLPRVVIAGAVRDHLAPIAMQRYLAENIPGAQFIELQGNHISGITTMDRIFMAIINSLEP